MADIELVIKVDKRDIDFVRKNFKPTGYSFIPLQIQNELISAILNGTSLPKGHDRLVEAKEVVKALFDHKTIYDVSTIIEADTPKKREDIPFDENDNEYDER